MDKNIKTDSQDKEEVNQENVLDEIKTLEEVAPEIKEQVLAEIKEKYVSKNEVEAIVRDSINKLNASRVRVSRDLSEEQQVEQVEVVSKPEEMTQDEKFNIQCGKIWKNYQNYIGANGWDWENS